MQGFVFRFTEIEVGFLFLSLFFYYINTASVSCWNTKDDMWEHKPGESFLALS